MSEEPGDFDPGDFDEHEQQDTTLQAKWHARAMALRALDRLESDPPLATGGDEEPGNVATDISSIESIKFA